MFVQKLFFLPVQLCRNNFKLGKQIRVNYCKMVDARLDAVPLVEIDTGIFKYILIKVYGKEKSDGSEPSKVIVRGFERSPFHGDIYDEVSSSLEALGLEGECLGGGRIEHRPDLKRIKVYGYSQGFGPADHDETKKILLTKYSNYEISTSDQDTQQQQTPDGPQNKLVNPKFYNNKRPNRGIAKSAGPRMSKEELADSFKPKNLSTVSSYERNDPLLTDSVMLEGASGATLVHKNRYFQIDISQFVTLVDQSYVTLSKLDREIAKETSPAMYLYYCSMILWKRLYYVRTERGNNFNEYATLIRKLPPMTIPEEIGLYLDGIGNITDPLGRPYQLQLQAEPLGEVIGGLSGNFGIVNDISHTAYETLLAPAVVVWRIMNDVAYTADPARAVNWDLPAGLRPSGNVNFIPNKNLLGWSPSQRLTETQRNVLVNSGLDVQVPNDHVGVIEAEWQGLKSTLGLPINYQLLRQISESLACSKSSAQTHTESESFKGSIAQVAYAITSADDIGYNRMRSIGDRDSTIATSFQLSSNLCSAATIFRYRQNRVRGQATGLMCYLGAQGDHIMGWLAHENDVFDSVPAWNTDDFIVTTTNGKRQAKLYVEKLRRIDK